MPVVAHFNETVKVRCSVDFDIPVGWEFVDYRNANEGESWVVGFRDQGEIFVGATLSYVCVIRKSWVPPDGLKSGSWLYPYDEAWFVSLQKPHQCGHGPVGTNWEAQNEYRIYGLDGDKTAPFTFTPPPIRRVYRVP